METKENRDNAKGQADDVVDAMGAGTTAVAVAQPAAVAVAQVQGAQLEFPFIRLGQGMSAWKTFEGKKPAIGCFYVGRNKENNVLVGGEGREAGVTGIVLDVVQGFKERRKWVAGMGAPRRWVVGAPKPDGTRMSEADALAEAAKEGFSLEPVPTGETWPDSGRPKMAANLDRFCYVLMLAKVPEAFESDEFALVPIGDALYTTARFEFEKQYYKSAMAVLRNAESRARFAHRADPGYVFRIGGTPVHIYSTTMTSRDGVEYVGPVLERAVSNGQPYALSEAEERDFAAFCESAAAGYDAGGADGGEAEL